eukprot:8659558-Pyramimonas_sp.AAC.1
MVGATADDFETWAVGVSTVSVTCQWHANGWRVSGVSVACQWRVSERVSGMSVGMSDGMSVG